MSDLLSWVKREPLDLDVWDIHDVIESALMQLAAALAKTRVEKSYSGDVPAVICDAQAISEAFLNVMLNAAEAMPRGGTLTIRTALSGPGSVRVEIEDTGGGIKAGPREKVFQFGFTTKPGGSGLGLSQAARAIEDHGGSIRAEDGRQGARFVIALPVAAQPGESMRDMGLRPELSEELPGLDGRGGPRGLRG